MKRRSLILFGTIAFFAGIVLIQAGLEAAPTITVTLTASSSSLAAYCPATITFSGAIKVVNLSKAPFAIQYKFVRSDGSSTGPITLNCSGAGVFPVTHSWTLGATYSGWEALEVISPVSVKSEKATFALTCLPKPQIDELYPENTNLQDTQFMVFGNHFGATQGNKNVTLDGQPALPKPGWSVVLWSDKQIFITIKTCDVIIWDHPYQIAITDGGQVVSNVVSRRFLYMVRIHNGQQNYFPGQAITVDIRNLPSSSSGYSLKLFSAFIPLPITEWTGAVGCIPGTITATIPQNTPAGSYQVELFKGGTRVSWDFTDIYVVKFQKLPLVIKK